MADLKYARILRSQDKANGTYRAGLIYSFDSSDKKAMADFMDLTKPKEKGRQAMAKALTKKEVAAWIKAQESEQAERSPKKGDTNGEDDATSSDDGEDDATSSDDGEAAAAGDGAA